MLVLTRKEGDRIYIGDNIEIMITSIGENSVRVGIKAPIDIHIKRDNITNESKKEVIMNPNT